MKKKINLLFCIVALFSLHACYEDKGSYDHTYSNVKEIDRFASSYVDDVILGDTIKIMTKYKLKIEYILQYECFHISKT